MAGGNGQPFSRVGWLRFVFLVIVLWWERSVPVFSKTSFDFLVNLTYMSYYLNIIFNE
jgi:hypothetical protein